MQLCPRPVNFTDFNKEKPTKRKPYPENFICKKAATGSRHSLFLMIESTFRPPVIRAPRKEDASSSSEDDERLIVKVKRKRKLLLTGLNQVGLCEEPGNQNPIEISFEEFNDRPVDIAAGRGGSFVITKRGHLYSFGNGKFGVLGHGDGESYTMPKRIMGLERKFISKVAMGGFHAIAMTDNNLLFGWGRNDKGQLGIGRESPEELSPLPVVFPPQAAKAELIEISCGHEHTIALIHLKTRVSEAEPLVYSWGDESRGQLGSGDREFRFRPQENRYVTKFCRSNNFRMLQISAGGYHNLVVLDPGGQMLSWGAGDYGQLGHGDQFDCVEPRIINGVDRVISMSAGSRHSMAICERHTLDVMGWGYNGFGELGMGDTNIRLNPSKISALKDSNVRKVYCGDRHSLFVNSHIPLKAKDLAALKPYFQILEVSL
jgi:alpha-tubulin suppressor-like RCC1 family protein